MSSSSIRILIAALGSHGDVHPFLGLGEVLAARGHEVRLIAPAMYEVMARLVGLEFVPIGTVEQFERHSSRADLWHPRKGFQVIAEATGEFLGEYYRAITENCERGRTILVLSSLALGGRVAQEVLGVPAVTIHLSPSVFRSNQKPAKTPPLPVAGWMPAGWNRLIFAAADVLGIDPALGVPVNKLRASVGLGPVKRIFDGWIHSPDRVIGLFPEWFAKPASDWPAQAVLTGFPLYDESNVLPMDYELERFLDSGEAPIAFTPGSAMRHGERFFAAAVEACRTLGRRGLLVSMHARHLPARLPKEIRHVKYAPFSRLLPRCASIVHHGGIGTSSQALAAGVPQLAMPMGFDQADNAARLKGLGVAEVLPAQRFSARRAAVLLERVMDPIHRGNCLVIQKRFEGQKPLEKTAELIEQTFHEHSESKHSESSL
jgi:UDP:flavonoid glycosyltransferase YjiC (YdhE family)